VSSLTPGPIGTLSLSPSQVIDVSLPWFDPRTYGAKGDGSTDDTAAVQAAFSAARTAGGGNVIINETYLISTTITIGDNTHVTGHGGLKYVASPTSTGFIGLINYDNGNGNTNIRVTGITLDGNKANRPLDTTSHLLRIIAADTHSCTNIVVDGLYLKNCAFAAMQLMNVVGCSVTNNRIDNTTRDSITVWFNSSDVVISGNIVTNSGDDCIALNSEVVASHVGTQINRVAITGNTLQGAAAAVFGSGIRIAGANDVTCVGNMIDYTQGWGIQVQGGNASGSSLPSQRVTVTGNTIRSAGTASSGDGGIATADSAVAVTITGNIVGGYYSNGIQCATAANVVGNYVGQGTSTSGVGIFANAKYITMQGNTLDQVQSSGVLISNEKCVVVGNTFFDCGVGTPGAGYCTVSANVNRAVITSNAFHKSTHGTFGVRLAAGTGTGIAVVGNIAQGFAGGNEFSDGTGGTNVIANNSTI
jgi:hypothetical protein